MRKIIASAFISFIFLFLANTTPVSAKIISGQNEPVNITKNEIINDDLFIGAQSVTVDGTVNGDVFIGAQSVKIDGDINGNLHVGTNTLDLSGIVTGNVYAGAQNILINGATISGSLIIGAATVNIDKDTKIGGSILAGAGSLNIDSKVKRSVYAGSGMLTIGSDAKIGKDLYYTSGEGAQQANISEGVVTGQIYKSQVDTKTKEIEAAKKELPAVFGGFKAASTILSLIGAIIVGFLYFKFFNKDFIDTSKLVSESFWKCLGIGFLISIAFIPGLIILLLTVVGIPLAGVAFLLLLIYMYLAKIVVALPVGNWISNRFNWKISVFGACIFGLLTIYIVKIIPIIGGLSGLVVFWSGLGALILNIFNKSEKI
jgi:hypothetical protein